MSNSILFYLTRRGSTSGDIGAPPKSPSRSRYATFFTIFTFDRRIIIALHILNDFIFLTFIGEVVPMEISTFQRALVDPGKKNYACFNFLNLMFSFWY